MSLKIILKHPNLYKRAIISSPALAIDPKSASPTVVTIAKTLSKFLPRLQLDPLTPEFLSDDSCVNDVYVNDPLICSDPVNVRIAAEMIRSFEYVHKHASEISIPYFLFHGDNDKICMLEGSTKLHEKTVSKDKTFKVYKGKHELFHEPNSKTINDVMEWLKDH